MKDNILKFTLIKNEFRKNNNPVKFLISIICIVVLIVAFGLFLNMDPEDIGGNQTEEEIILQEKLDSASDWKERYQLQMEMNSSLSELYGEEYVDMQNSLLQYKIDNNIAPKEHGNNWCDFSKYVFSTLGFIIVIMAAFIFTQTLNIEYNNKTEKLLFTKPFSRNRILASKYFVSVVFLLGLTAIWYFISFIVGGIMFSFKEINATSVLYFNHDIFETTIFKESICNAMIVFVNAFICGTISFAVCSISRSRIAGICSGLGLFFIGKPVTQNLFESGIKWVKYLPFSYTNMKMFINNPLNTSFNMINGCILIGALLVILMSVSLITLKKRDI